MIEIPDLQTEHRLLTFRCSSRPDQWQVGTVHEIEQLPHHRDRYLDYQGEISGDRGRVDRVAAGECGGIDVSQLQGGGFRITILWNSGYSVAKNYVGKMGINQIWSVRLVGNDSHQE